MNTLAKEMLLLLLMTFFSSTQANSVTVTGNKVSFTYESSLLGLFGTPTVAGDQLFFTPTAFVAKAYGEKAFDLKNSTINIKVTTLNGGTIDRVNVTEKGDYIRKGNTSYIDAGGQIRVTDLSAPLNEVTDALTPTLPFVQQSNFFPTQNWQATANAYVSAFGVPSINVSIENILVALSNAFDDVGFIEKKAVILSIISVPLPAAIWLFGITLLSLLAYSKRIHYI